MSLFDYASQPKLAVDACPACREVGVRATWYGFDRYGYSVKRHTCARCGLGYLGEVLTRTGYDAFYAGPYRRLVWAATNSAAPFNESVMLGEVQQAQLCYARQLEKLLPSLPPGMRVLDAGGSTGLVSRSLDASYHFHCITVLDPAAQELPIGRIGCVQGYLEDPIPGGPYDLILCCETLDHLTDPRTALRNMREVLAPGGFFYVDVVDKRTWGVHDARIKIDHPLYWTGKSLRRALLDAGFTIERVMTLKWVRSWRTFAICRANP